MRPVSLYPGEDGYWVAECPSLPGCVSQGETRELALENLREAIQLYVEALEEDGLPIPEELGEIAVMLFGEEALTLGQASDLARMGVRSFLGLLAKQEVPIHYDVAEFQEDLATLRRLGQL